MLFKRRGRRIGGASGNDRYQISNIKYQISNVSSRFRDLLTVPRAILLELRRTIDDHPEQSKLSDRAGEFIEVHRLHDVSVDAEVVTSKDVLLFAR